MLYLGKLIIDEVVFLTAAEDPDFHRVGVLVLIELALAASTDLVGRGVAVADSLLGDLVSHDISLRLMDHSTRLDIGHFEDSEFYDKLERARRQASNRILLISQSLNQVQDLLTVVTLSLALIAFNPWLLLLLGVALIPAFLGETHFTGQSYSLMYGWTEERRELATCVTPEPVMKPRKRLRFSDSPIFSNSVTATWPGTITVPTVPSPSAAPPGAEDFPCWAASATTPPMQSSSTRLSRDISASAT